MRFSIATIISNSEIRTSMHLIEMHAPQLAQAVQPGQYCMVRCCHAEATDPMLRRPFFVHRVQRGQGLCSLLVSVRGRGTSWLAKQQEGATLDILGPLGHGWTVRPTVSNLLLVAEEGYLPSLLLLAQIAIEQEIAVTLVAQSSSAEIAYPPALLPSEVEYHIVTRDGSLGQQGELIDVLPGYLGWADAVCCSVSHETSVAFYSRFERMHSKHFAQGIILRPLVCGSGACLACSIEIHSDPKLVCRDGPVFPLREIVEREEIDRVGSPPRLPASTGA
jgi:dihydroorotate dehydrogenase electron transfer subunit